MKHNYIIPTMILYMVCQIGFYAIDRNVLKQYLLSVYMSSFYFTDYKKSYMVDPQKISLTRSSEGLVSGKMSGT